MTFHLFETFLENSIKVFQKNIYKEHISKTLVHILNWIFIDFPFSLS